MTLSNVFALLGGLVVLVAGAELLVRGASRLAASLGVSALVIGLTVVSWGTSAPEVVVSVSSTLAGRGDLAFGNVVGSNSFNILFILGLSAAITPLVVARKLVRVDVPIMIGSGGLTWLFARDGRISRLEGLLLLACLAAYTLLCVRSAVRESPSIARERGPRPEAGRHSGWSSGALVVLGLVLLVAGANWFVGGAVDVARALGVSELIVGLTIVAAGTSLPEVATSVMAAWRGEREIAVGNVVGSNLFNLLGVLGISSAVAPGGVPAAPAALAFDVPVMIAASLACLPVFFTGFAIARWEGWVLLGYYCAYTGYLVLEAQQHDALASFSGVMWGFAIPLTALGVGLSVVRALRRKGVLERAAARPPGPGG